MEHMMITSAEYLLDLEGDLSIIKSVIDGVEMFVPLDPANRHYTEIMRQVEAGELVIQEADTPE